MRFVTAFFGIAVLAAPAYAALLIDEDIVRPTRHSGSWVPSSVYAPLLSFTADGPEAIIQFSAQTHSTDTAGWLRQAVDNVAVVTRTVYDAHLLARNPSDLTNYFWLQIEPSYPIFFFDHNTVNPSDFKFFDQFATGVGAHWDTTNGGYFVNSSNFSFSEPSAPTTDLVDPSNTTGGSMGLGLQNATPGTATANVVVGGLQAGTEYVLSFWWLSNNDNLGDNGEPNPNGDLFVKIFGTEVVNVEAKTWTGIKSLYRAGR